MKIKFLGWLIIALISSTCSSRKGGEDTSASDLNMTQAKTTEKAMSQHSKTINSNLSTYIKTYVTDYSEIPEERKMQLEELSGYIRNALVENKEAKLTFICTHNSRRSHLSQIWAQTAASFYGIENIKTYSGGTEATAFNPRAVSAMKKAGFDIVKTDESSNPKYEISFAPGAPVLIAFSKKFSDDINPQNDFCAIMTCSQADKACPIVPGANERLAIPYEDPKAFDGTELEAKMYDERSKQIATEMFYAFSKV